MEDSEVLLRNNQSTKWKRSGSGTMILLELDALLHP